MSSNKNTRVAHRIISVADLVRTDLTPVTPSDVRDSTHTRSSSSRGEPVWPMSSRFKTQATSELRGLGSDALDSIQASSKFHGPRIGQRETLGFFEMKTKHYAKLLTPFIYKLYCLVEEEETNDLCEWASNGNAFIVHKPTKFAATVLPRYFKHNQFSSFVRQLNKYSFHKLTPAACIFGHRLFIRDRVDLLLQITPRKQQGKRSEQSAEVAGGAPLCTLRGNMYDERKEAHDITQESISKTRMSTKVGNGDGSVAGFDQNYSEKPLVTLESLNQGLKNNEIVKGVELPYTKNSIIEKRDYLELLKRLSSMERANVELINTVRECGQRIEELEFYTGCLGVRRQEPPRQTDRNMESPAQKRMRYEPGGYSQQYR